jgi:hypothetical protein
MYVQESIFIFSFLPRHQCFYKLKKWIETGTAWPLDPWGHFSAVSSKQNSKGTSLFPVNGHLLPFFFSYVNTLLPD